MSFVGLDTSVTYEKLGKSEVLLIRNGAKFIGTNTADSNLPNERGNGTKGAGFDL